jgi:hypothetical protein
MTFLNSNKGKNMNLFTAIFKSIFSDNSASTHAGTEINPANGLPMIENSGIDVLGNSYGTDHSSDSSSFWSSSNDASSSWSSGSDWSSSSSDWGSSSGSSDW